MGALAAVRVALWVALRERRREGHERREREMLDAETENTFLVEALFRYRSMKGFTGEVLEQFKQGGGVALNPWKDEMLRVRDAAGARVRHGRSSANRVCPAGVRFRV